MNFDKRRQRELKRILKRAGNKHQRREVKRQIADSPDDAAHADYGYGRYGTSELNGIDRDPTRLPCPEPLELLDVPDNDITEDPSLPEANEST